VNGATLKLRNLATDFVFTATSDQAGNYIFPVVPVGTYEISAEKTGFAPAKQSKFQVQVGNTLSLPLVFRVAGSVESVQVTGEAPLIETTRTSVATNVNDRAIQELPVNGRNFLDFALLTPGVTRDTRSGDLSFAGQRGTLNSLTIDGTDDNNSFYGQTAARTGFKTPYQFSQDSVQEFQVATNGYSAEIGRAGGAVINVVTKSGSNQFHGDLFEFYRDQSMNAYDPIQKQNFYIKSSNQGLPMPAKSKYHFHQFGGNVGGPIWKDRAFFFFDLDDQRNTQPNLISSYSTPASPNTEQSAAIKYLADRNQNYNKTNNQNTYLLKTDFVINQKNQLSARWNRQRFTAGEQENAGTTSSLEHTGNSYIHTDNANLSLTTAVTPKVVNVLRFAFLKDREPGSANSDKAEATVKQGGTTLLAVGRNDFSPRETTIKQEQYSDSLTWALGRQTVKIGGDVIVDKIMNNFPGNFYGNYTFNSLLDFGCSLLLEAPGTTTTAGACATPTYIQAFAGAGTTGAVTHPDTLMPDFFAQDDIQLLHNLTINIGLRYDYQSVKYSGVQNATALANGYDTSKQQIANNEVSPRFGFAWSASNKMVLRGGYGLFYGTTNSMLLGTAMSNNGINVGTYTYTGAAVPLYPNTLCGAPGRPLCSAPTGGASSSPSIDVVASNYQNPVVQQANLGMEYALTDNLSFTISGMHVKGDHLQRTADQNLGTPTTTSIKDQSGNSYTYLKYPSARPIAAFTRISLFQSNSDSTYNGLIAQINKRFSHGLQSSVSYTWSHVIDDAPDATSVVVGNSGDDAKIAMYPTMPWLDRGNGGADLRHRVAISYVANLNTPGSLPVFARAVLAGWSTSGILSVQSGLAYSAMVSGNLLNEGNSYNNRLPGTGRNQYRMPATWSYDPRVTRDFRLHSQSEKRVQFFAEAFNLFNHFNVTGVKTNAYTLNTTTNTLIQQNSTASPTGYFGLPSQSNPSQRIIQLGAKIIF
jgi:hypothetical protein